MLSARMTACLIGRTSCTLKINGECFDVLATAIAHAPAVPQSLFFLLLPTSKPPSFVSNNEPMKAFLESPTNTGNPKSGELDIR